MSTVTVQQAAKRRSWRSHVARALLLLLLLLLLAAASGAGWFYWRANQLFKPTPITVPQSLEAYAGEQPIEGVPTQSQKSIDWTHLADPPVDAGPYLRWWWPGADVEAGELRRELQVIRKGGFGGVEIQPFLMGTFAVQDADPAAKARILGVDSPRYFDLVRGVMTDADRLGLKVDLTHYSGWPGGSPAVTPFFGSQSLAWSEASFKGGRRVEIAVPRPRPGLNAWANVFASIYSGLGDFNDFDAGAAQLMSAVVARPTGGGHSLFSIRDTLTLDPKSVRVVDGMIRNGRFSWDAPPGDWVLVASWIMPTGEQASLAAMKAPVYIVDPLNARAVDAEYNYVYGQRTGLSHFYGKPFRAIFNDSLEFKADRMSARDFLAEFRKRRGYDLRPWLPIVYRAFADNFTIGEVLPHPAVDFRISAQDERVRYDYQLTLSDLIIERFVDRSRRWAAARGLLSRGQSYGMDLDMVRALGANDIPETEQLYAGGSDAFLRFASSGGMLYDRPQVGAESMVWGNQDYVDNAAKLKLSADRMFLAGVNQIVYHGYPYDWRREDRARWFLPTGWDPWSSPERSEYMFSGNYSDRSPLWPDLTRLNRYIARVQNALRQGQQQADVLIFYPFLGLPVSGYGPDDTREPLMLGEFPLADPAGGGSGRVTRDKASTDERVVWLRKVQPLLDGLAQRGITWSWVSGDGIRNRLLPGGRTRGGARYGGLLFADADAVHPADLAAAKALAIAGTPVMIYGRPPSRQPGLGDANAGDRRVRVDAAFLAARSPLDHSPSSGANRIAALVAPSLRYTSPVIRRYERTLPTGRLHFLANPTGAPQRVRLAGVGQSDWWFDAASGGIAPTAVSRDGSVELRLPPYGSRLLVQGIVKPGAPRELPVFAMNYGRRWNAGGWTMQVGSLRRSGLPDWRADPELRFLAGPATYRAKLTMPVDPGRRYALVAPAQAGSATLSINGRAVGSISVPGADIDVTRLLRSGVNIIEVRYRAPIRNAMIGAWKNGDKRAAQFKGREDALVPAGLRGDISIVELTP
ncbi:hypothetical protein LK533_16470 [Sphingomonas sp. PL-96]|uniref:glycosyl hydrolase n=1 Tax=Sphingomonas sp. PL-96 TaxID=2887201 RepID=UPI001E30AED2|nr:glycosyl hydrolase [Sphingomonas sp. PL-96]MCC2978248.1 hypothetical protein [Sphingomonas sp. PL-96]